MPAIKISTATAGKRIRAPPRSGSSRIKPNGRPAINPAIATSRVKWNRAYQRKIGLRTGPAGELPDGKLTEMQRTAKRIYRALELSGYARIDFRMDAEGQVWVLEANPNPDLCREEDFSKSAQKAGIEYDGLVGRILGLGRAYEPAWMG